MKHFIFYSLTVSLLLLIAGCSAKKGQVTNIVKPDSVLVSRSNAYNRKLPKQSGVFTEEKCEYDGTAITISIRTKKNDYDVTDPENLKWLPAIKLNEIESLDTEMIVRLIQLNQPLKYAVYTDKEQKPYKIFALQAKTLKGRAESYGMLK